MQIKLFRLVHLTLAVLVVLHANLGAMVAPSSLITPEEKAKIEAFIKENSKFSERNKKEVLESKKSSIKPAYWVAGGIAAVLATILITAAYDENEGKFAAHNLLKLFSYFSRAQNNAPAPNAQPQPGPAQQPQEKPVSTLSHVGQEEECF